MEDKRRADAMFASRDTFVRRHVGPNAQEQAEMLSTLGLSSLEELVKAVVPDAIRMEGPLALGAPRGEHELLKELAQLAENNSIYRSYLGMGYVDCITPPVIQRNILENPGWYTQYTPYQAEISQGRLEALLNYQTMVTDLTGLPLSNASLLDEATAAAEAMGMCYAIGRKKKKGFFVSQDCHPQTIAVVQTRAEPLGIEVHVGAEESFDFSQHGLCGALIQYPTTQGHLRDPGDVIAGIHEAGGLAVMAADLLALTMLKPPGEWGADIALGSTQRFGVPMGFGGPHAAYLAVAEAYKRQIPGRLIGVSRDAQGRKGYRLSLQTREQHIRRDRATSNICTSQVLLAVMASMYAVYHGPDGLREIAEGIRGRTCVLAEGLKGLGYSLDDAPFFDTLHIALDEDETTRLSEAALAQQLNLRTFAGGGLGITLDEATTREEVQTLLTLFAQAVGKAAPDLDTLSANTDTTVPAAFARESKYLEHEVFNRYHAEHEMLRYMNRLQARDLSLTTSMIPLGSCTMKLNGTSEMLPVTWPAFAQLHPYAPPAQAQGYATLFAQLEAWLAEITGFSAVSLQPNAGSQGEYAGLLVIRAYHQSRGEGHRNVCLIPQSAHGTNPASAVMAGFKVVAVDCNERGDIDLASLEAKAEAHKDALAALMVTYPSTHGVFEERIREVCEIVHRHGGQVYMDGANMNAQVGLCRPGDFGADVCHLNLHKTFCIPHGGGGPGMGPIGVAPHLAPFLPGHPFAPVQHEQASGAISAAPYGSPSILPISWVYIALMGAQGLTQASQVAILNANYMAARLKDHYELLYTGEKGFVAHEFILDLRPFKAAAKVEVADVAKRLMDYGFHAPTMSWPVPGTLMIEPTESENKGELDRFCEAMLKIRQEIQDIIDGTSDPDNNPLKHAPHPASTVMGNEWPHPYSREQAAYPAPWLRDHKYWPPVSRIDDAYGDRHLMCTCPPMDSYQDD